MKIFIGKAGIQPPKKTNKGPEVKGALDNFSLIPKFFFKKVEIFKWLEVYTYVVTAC